MASPTEAYSEYVRSQAVWTKEVARQHAFLRALPDPGVSRLSGDAKTGLLLILEPRESELLDYVCRNFAQFLAGPDGWALMVCHGTGNGRFVRNMVASWPGSPAVLTRELPYPDFSGDVYNRILTDPDFWRSLPDRYGRVLVFQTDTMLLSGDGLLPDSPKFLDYEYVGAPWPLACPITGGVFAPVGKEDSLPLPEPRLSETEGLRALWPELVGNGGLSLRSREAMIRACESFRRRDAGIPPDEREELPARNEDVFFAVALTRMGRKVAPRTVASEFSAEMVTPTYLDRGVTGLHKPYGYLSAAVVARLVGASRLGAGTVSKVPRAAALEDAPAPLQEQQQSSPDKPPRYDTPSQVNGDMVVLTRSGSRAQRETVLLPESQRSAPPERRRRARALGGKPAPAEPPLTPSVWPAVWTVLMLCGTFASVGVAAAVWCAWGYLLRVESFMGQAEPLLQAVICVVQHPQPPACAHILRLFYVGNASAPG
jgi:hypothetical protein